MTMTMTHLHVHSRLKSLVRSALAWTVCAISGLVPAYAADVLYATGGGGGLYSVNAQMGANSLLWYFPGVDIDAGGLAYDATTDLLYATGVELATPSTSRLFSIDRFTGAITASGGIGNFISLNSGGLAIDPLTGVMYATGGYNDGVTTHQSSALFTIDKTTGAGTLIGFAGGNCCTGDFGIMLNGIGFRSDGTLFANGWALGGPSYPQPISSYLYTVDLGSGEANLIGPSGVTLGRSLRYSGLAFSDNGTLLSMGSFDAASGALYAVDPNTGWATSLYSGGPYGSAPIHFGVDGGLALAPGAPVPEPASHAMLLAGLAVVAGLALRRRDRRR